MRVTDHVISRTGRSSVHLQVDFLACSRTGTVRQTVGKLESANATVIL